MIPVSLELRDFLSYVRPVRVDFTSFDVACLTGDNGAGKSALLDAITWCLWGCARGCESGMNQERLIRDGSDDTAVEYTFELQDETYRVARRRSRVGKAELRFLVRDGDDWRNLAAETLRETEARIAALLRLDYRAFVASAFFVQGRSDDFLARMRPDERREVFARLLDLGMYEELADAARGRARDAEARRTQREARARELGSAPVDLRAAEDAFGCAGTAVEDAKEKSAQAAEAVRASRDAVAELEKVEALLDAAASEHRIAAQAIAELRNDADGKRNALAQTDELLAREEEIREAVAEAVTLRAEDEQLEASHRRAVELAKQRAEIVERVDGERNAIATRLHERNTRKKVVERELRELEKLATKRGDTQERIAELGDVRKVVDDVREQLASTRTELARYDEQLHALDRSEAEITEKLALLRSGGGECPVCGTALDAAHRTKAKRALDGEVRECKKQRETIASHTQTAKKEVARAQEEEKRALRSLAEWERLASVQTDLDARLDREPLLRAELSETTDAVAIDERALQDDAFAAGLRETQRQIEAELATAYDAQEHERVRARLRSLLRYEALLGRLEEAQRTRGALIDDIETALERTAAAERELVVRSEKIAEMEQSVQPLGERRAALAAAERELEEAQTAAAAAGAEYARLEAQVEAAKASAAALETALKEEVEAALEHRRYARLVEAFGRAGIPQLIIENERPHLEDEANRVLGALSDDEMSVQFRFQRETKAGKARETLEVLVRPHDGEPREFAMFSGGEAFRIAFAVRLALSKLLTRRAGARLETLVVDEGFGSQDPQGRERLVEAINLARDEFRKILVVTHLDELKDQFPAQIRVSKDAGGSVLELAGA